MYYSHSLRKDHRECVSVERRKVSKDHKVTAQKKKEQSHCQLISLPPPLCLPIKTVHPIHAQTQPHPSLCKQLVTLKSELVFLALWCYSHPTDVNHKN